MSDTARFLGKCYIPLDGTMVPVNVVTGWVQVQVAAAEVAAARAEGLTEGTLRGRTGEGGR